jgi:hypothetical protein
LYNGFNYIPDSELYKNYKNLNKNSYLEKKYKNYFYNNRILDNLFDLSYPITGQLPIDNLKLVDKHVWGYTTQRLEKLSIYSETTLNNIINHSKRKFRNKAYGDIGFENNTTIPMYLTNRKQNNMKLIFNGTYNDNINILSLIRNNSPEYYNFFGYHNILSMGNLENFGSKTNYIDKFKLNDSFFKSNEFENILNSSKKELLGLFDNKNQNKLTNDINLNSYLKKNKNINSIFFLKNKQINFEEIKKENSWDTNKLFSNSIIKKRRFRNYFEIFEELLNKKYNKMVFKLGVGQTNKIKVKLNGLNIKNINLFNNYNIAVDQIEESILTKNDKNYNFFETTN